MDPITALVLGGGTLLGGLFSKSSSDKATSAQTATAQSNERMYRDFRSDDIARQQPFYNAGVNALSRYQSQLGDSYETSDYANYLINNGRDQIESGAAGRGGLFSGSTLSALDDHRTGVIAADRDNWMNRLYSLAQGGSQAAAFQGNTSQAYAGQIGQSNAAAGNAISANYINQGNNVNSLIGNALSIYGYMNGPTHA